MFFDYPRTDLGLKKTHIALSNFNSYLQKTGTKYAATGKKLNFPKTILKITF